MFSRIVGTLVERGAGEIVLDVGGLGYAITLPPCVEEKITQSIGEPVTLEIFAHLQMDGNAGHFSYFGFTNAVEREFFEALIGVASIGPKSAARAFALPMARIARAIDDADHATLKSLPGIGQQKARDIVAKLQGKVARFLLIREPVAAAGKQPQSLPQFAREALDVLLQLEYRRPEAEAMIAQTLERAPHLGDAEALLGEIYRGRAQSPA